jgi:uncharacterized iron-regulated membrane protein
MDKPEAIEARAAAASARARAARPWLRRPQTVPLRKALFQVHLWTGLISGLYVIMISVTGSIAVFRRDLAQWLLADVKAGDPFPAPMRAMEWLVDLHDNLLAGPVGRLGNGIGAMVVMVSIATGVVLWWPGTRRWWKSLLVPRPSRTPRFWWHLHSALGFWSLLLLLMWIVTGIYFAFPAPFEGLMGLFDSNPADLNRPGEGFLLALIRLHFGRFGGVEIQALWCLLGLIPALLFVTGFIVWWKRQLAKRRRPRS